MASLQRRQRGMGFWALLVVLGTLVILGLTGLKLFPVYMEAFKVDQALEKIVRQDDIKTASKQAIHEGFLRYMSIEDVNRFNRKSLQEQMKVEKRKDEVTITLTYQAEAKLFGNLSIVADWNKVVTSAP